MSYKRRLLRQLRRCKPGLYEVVVKHDDACTIWLGKGCDCRATVGRPVPIGPPLRTAQLGDNQQHD